MIEFFAQSVKRALLRQKEFEFASGCFFSVVGRKINNQ